MYVSFFPGRKKKFFKKIPAIKEPHNNIWLFLPFISSRLIKEMKWTLIPPYSKVSLLFNHFTFSMDFSLNEHSEYLIKEIS